MTAECRHGVFLRDYCGACDADWQRPGRPAGMDADSGYWRGYAAGFGFALDTARPRGAWLGIVMLALAFLAGLALGLAWPR